MTEHLTTVFGSAGADLPRILTLGFVAAVLAAADWSLRRRWQGKPQAQYRLQLILLSLTFAGILAVVVALPVGDSLRGQLLSLIGLLLSAAIALSSTTFIGNLMAGLMLRLVKRARARGRAISLPWPTSPGAFRRWTCCMPRSRPRTATSSPCPISIWSRSR